MKKSRNHVIRLACLVGMSCILLGGAGCGRSVEGGLKTSVKDDASEPEAEAATDEPHLAFFEAQLKALFGAEKMDWKVNQREQLQVETLLPSGSKRIWTLEVIPYPAQAQVFQKSIEKSRGKPGFEESLGLGADWGKDDSPVLRVVARDDLVFQLSVVDDLPFFERVEAMKGETGQRWRADAVALAQPLIEHLKSVFK